MASFNLSGVVEISFCSKFKRFLLIFNHLLCDSVSFEDGFHEQFEGEHGARLQKVGFALFKG
jgi:hypothetical protein